MYKPSKKTHKGLRACHALRLVLQYIGQEENYLQRAAMGFPSLHDGVVSVWL